MPVQHNNHINVKKQPSSYSLFSFVSKYYFPPFEDYTLLGGLNTAMEDATFCQLKATVVL
jgi:hypothetical protein